MEGGGLRVAMTLAMVHGTVWGVPQLRMGRSNFKIQHSHNCETTSRSSSSSVAPGISPPPPGPSGHCMRA